MRTLEDLAQDDAPVDHLAKLRSALEGCPECVPGKEYCDKCRAMVTSVAWDFVHSEQANDPARLKFLHDAWGGFNPCTFVENEDERKERAYLNLEVNVHSDGTLDGFRRGIDDMMRDWDG